MVVSSRGILAIGLCLTGLAMLVAPSVGQQQREQDPSLRKSGTTSSAGPKAPVAAFVGTVDLDAVFKNYKKVQIASKQFNAEMLAKKNELMKIESDGRDQAEMLAKMTPGSEEYRKRENIITDLRARLQAKRDQAEREFALKQAESMATLYKEVQSMVAAVAKWRQLNYIVRVSNQPIMGTDPNSVLNAINNPVVFADPHNDITNDVVHNLNRMYEATAAPTPKTSGRAPADRPAPGAQPEQ
jgi:Skp family chaperone for outer membrane proteins